MSLVRSIMKLLQSIRICTILQNVLITLLDIITQAIHSHQSLKVILMLKLMIALIASQSSRTLFRIRSTENTKDSHINIHIGELISELLIRHDRLSILIKLLNQSTIHQLIINQRSLTIQIIFQTIIITGFQISNLNQLSTTEVHIVTINRNRNAVLRQRAFQITDIINLMLRSNIIDFNMLQISILYKNQLNCLSRNKLLMFFRSQL